MKTTAIQIRKYFAAHRPGQHFEVEAHGKHEAAIIISREDAERYLGTCSTCIICSETARPYTKGPMQKIGECDYHEKCFKEAHDLGPML